MGHARVTGAAPPNPTIYEVSVDNLDFQSRVHRARYFNIAHVNDTLWEGIENSSPDCWIIGKIIHVGLRLVEIRRELNDAFGYAEGIYQDAENNPQNEVNNSSEFRRSS